MDGVCAAGAVQIEEDPVDVAGLSVLADRVDGVAAPTCGLVGDLYTEPPRTPVLLDAAVGREPVRRGVDDPMRELDLGAYTGGGRRAVEPADGQPAVGVRVVRGMLGKVGVGDGVRAWFSAPTRFETPAALPERVPYGLGLVPVRTLVEGR